VTGSAVVRVDFTARAGEGELTVVAERIGNRGYSAARRPQAADFPADLVEAVRDWADAGLVGVDPKYRIPAELIAYLQEWISAKPGANNDSGRIVARYVMDMLSVKS